MYKLLALKRLQTPGTQAPTTRFSLSFVSSSHHLVEMKYLEAILLE